MEAQTKEQVLAKVKEMLETLINDGSIFKEAQRLVNSGALPLQNYGDTFELPKCVLTVALENTAWQYLPFTKELKKIVNNLKHF